MPTTPVRLLLLYHRCSVVIVRGIITFPPLLTLHRHDILLPLEHITPRCPLLALPPTLADLALCIPHDAQGARVPISGVGGGLEPEAALDLQPRVAGEVADVPQGVGLALKEGHDDGGAGGQGGQGALEEGDEERLVMA
ncbi:hypothetical protein FZEAL_6128, partial [Fusarium zealandicum]